MLILPPASWTVSSQSMSVISSRWPIKMWSEPVVRPGASFRPSDREKSPKARKSTWPSSANIARRSRMSWRGFVRMFSKSWTALWSPRLSRASPECSTTRCTSPRQHCGHTPDFTMFVLRGYSWNKSAARKGDITVTSLNSLRETSVELQPPRPMKRTRCGFSPQLSTACKYSADTLILLFPP